VLALAWLTSEQDRRNNAEELGAWPLRMAQALQARFPDAGKDTWHSALARVSAH
jgi:hypothetical protein